MLRILSGILVLGGLIVASWSAYNWWSESASLPYEPTVVEQIVKKIDDKTIQPTLKQGITSSKKFTRGERIGALMIPSLEISRPIVQGQDDHSLKKGIGAYIEDNNPITKDHTVNPGDTGHVVLAGHRDTQLKGIGKVKVGDKLVIDFEAHYFVYQIRKGWKTDPDDPNVIVTKDKPTLSLITCYPFDYFGSAPYRYIWEAELIAITNK
ncbi:sortase A [Thermoactinomyces sp. DSM 45891]|uniref:sortase n=1 Tax=Thermoactinomyces sp. DSM 45891 TaxID=1761907 RepID=UPI00091AFE20|nr:sortase [Thermoactinomyces sp. DSM 45891]SFX31473.1 sortase A [Thermoactinomyces sp. DSM 45891]